MQNENNQKYLIGFIGQGFVGKNQADDFERRGFNTVRYSLEQPFVQNKDKIKYCDIVFIAVPTPTTPKGFDYSLIEGVLPLVGKGKIAVIRSTILPGVTKTLQDKFPSLYVMHSPEFLSEATAARDAAFPPQNIIGIAREDRDFRSKAEIVLSVLPNAPYSKITGSTEAEFIKYAHNCSGVMRIIFANIMYDLAESQGANWRDIEDAWIADPVNGPTYSRPIHKSGRGAGGHCFIKDFAALRVFTEQNLNDTQIINILRAVEDKNVDLLTQSNKDLDLLQGIYGEMMLRKPKITRVGNTSSIKESA
jgi:nucleotide sugar dehydrogenase